RRPGFAVAHAAAAFTASARGRGIRGHWRRAHGHLLGGNSGWLEHHRTHLRDIVRSNAGERRDVPAAPGRPGEGCAGEIKTEVLEVLSPGLGATLQDEGRPGWRRFGVPLGGAMDDHAARWANRLLDNSAKAPVVEMLLQGARLQVLQPVWIAVTGADA